MSAAKPGPWLAKHVATHPIPGWVILWTDTSKPGVHHRRLDIKGTFSEADARLIAAAPELLEAAELLCQFSFTSSVSLGDIQERARAAIAKATGSAA
jgi:hypothetical protein